MTVVRSFLLTKHNGYPDDILSVAEDMYRNLFYTHRCDLRLPLMVDFSTSPQPKTEQNDNRQSLRIEERYSTYTLRNSSRS